MLEKQDCGLIIVDVQGKLARIVQHSDLFIANVKKLIKCCSILNIPIIWLEQNPQGLGHTIAEILESMDEPPRVNEKFHFNALLEEPIKKVIKDTGKRQWLVAGMEAHICVYQTVLGLIKQDFECEVITDCISSRLQSNIDVAVQKMQKKGADITTLEMCIYELVKDARADEFKQILSVIR